MACIQNNAIYTLRNCKGGTVLDLSGGDDRSIIGYHDHNGPNQAWIFEQRGHGEDHGWFIKSVGSGQFLGFEGELRDGVQVIATSSPAKWDVRDSDVPGVQGIRILAHRTNFSVDLSDNGNPTEGTKVELWGSWEAANQIWALVSRR
ncbi:carbohydrate-binding module family 13 protein [Suillus paluster]|uniref:carbohydrate-binding module family 13 protein n=1 Tax=Suillus paluster TaxID=48578 RepID=UPI001B862AF5|nr:carbohydrate-binding module family 13 protein [Suillus paluster]KAG1728372.1 carbohydrate-binding module family 13 protein [Suillus paluster]